MKWQAIAGITSQINREAREHLARKLEKDASVQIPHLWADFLADTARHLHQSQSNLEIGTDEKTGSLAAITQFDELHEDFQHNRKPFLGYVLDKYDQRAAGYLAGVRNPFTRRFLEQKTGNYRMHLAARISSTEARLIEGKRHSLAIEAIAKLKKAAYDNPDLYESHRQDCTTALTSLSLLPEEKDKLLHMAKEELAYAAALGSLWQSPEAVLNPHNTPVWKADLSLEQRVKLEQQATTLVRHKQIMMQGQVKSLSRSHFASLLKTGQGIRGFDNLLHASFSADDPELHYLKKQEALHKQAFFAFRQLKTASFAAGSEILKQLAPQPGDLNYDEKEKIYNILIKKLEEQIGQAQTDPARLVEELFSEEIPQDISPVQRLLLRKQLQEQKGIPAYGQRYLMRDERSDYLARLQLPDAGEIKKQLDNISAISDDNYQLGRQLLDEILQAEKGKAGRRLSALTHLYISTYLYKNNDLMHDVARAIAAQGQLFGEFAGDDKRAIKKTISDSPLLQDFEAGMLQGTPDNAALIEQIRESILNLARFYQHQKHLEPADATRQAIEQLITRNYIRPIDGLYLPAKIIEDGQLVELNSEYLNYNLSKLRSDLIHDRLPAGMSYDKVHSFGMQYDDERQSVLDKRIKEILREGQFKLTPDQKHIYFIYYDEHGVHNLLTDSNTIWHVPLTSLNNPPGGKDRLMRDLQELNDLLEYNPAIFKR